MHPLTTALALTALATLSASVQGADVVAIDWGSAGSFERTLSVPAGKFAEVCGKLSAPAKVAWAFEADAPTDFNVHFHEGKQVTYPARLVGVMQAGATLLVDAPRDYCWMWTNKTGKPAQLKLTLTQGR